MNPLDCPRLLALLAGALLAACGGGDPEDPPEDTGPAAELVELRRTYEFKHWRGPQSVPGADTQPTRHELPGELLRFQDFGGLLYDIPGTNARARAEVYSNATGNTYWVYATAPADDGTDAPVSGNQVAFEQVQAFRKLRADARLSYVITHAELIVTDFNTRVPDESDCPYEIVYKSENVMGRVGRTWTVVGVRTWPDYVQTHCSHAIQASLNFSIAGRFEGKYLGGTAGELLLQGWQGDWEFWFDDEFSGLEEDRWQVDTEGGAAGTSTYASAMLKRDIRVPMDLKDVPVDGIVYVTSKVTARTANHRYGESGAFATFKDPVTGAAGPRIEFDGLQPVALPLGVVPPPAERPTPACANAPGQAGGAIAFVRGRSDELEHPGSGARIELVRTDGSAGEASVQVDTIDGSAIAGADYEPVHRRVHFADGQTRRTVFVPLTQDAVREDLKTLTLRIGNPLGCATLGALTEATLGIHDDDHPLPPKTTYTVGGTVSGLLGSGLVLQDRQQGVELAVQGNGSFAFNRAYSPGAAYEIVVAASPGAPAQACEVAFDTAAGNVVATVDNIQVVCSPPTLPGSLDPSFGTLGKVAEGLPGGAIAVARQSTGHILATNGARLVRFTPDGRPDRAFGNGAGFVDHLLPMTGGAVADLAVLADDRIVVAGRVLQPGKSPPYYQMAAARFSAAGVPDAGFGLAGLATVRLAGLGEQATRVLALPDGRIVLVGQTTVQDDPAVPQFNNNIALVRLAPDGVPDASFGTAGAVVADALLRDFAFAAARQADGRIFIAGRTSNTNADATDTLFTRVDANGALEPGFGRNPAYSTLDDEAVDVAIQPDGRIVLLVAARGLNAEVALVRLNADGSADTGFGLNGLVRTDVGPHDDLPRAVALQADGKIVVAAQLSAAVGPPDFGLLRYLADGTPDAGFGTGGVLRVDFFGGWDSANDIVLQPDGRIVVAGFARSGLSTELAMVRLMP